MLQNVYYIPRLKSNLISLGQLTESGHKITMDEDCLEVIEKCSQRVILKVVRTRNRLYQVDLKSTEPVCFLTNLFDEAWLWHERLGHANFNSLKMLTDKAMVGGVPEIAHPDEVCDACLARKQTRMPFPKQSQWRAVKPLELLHIDLCGPITPATAGGNKYFMLIVDDFSRWTTVFMLKSKDEASAVFAKFKSEIENKHEKKIKKVRSDRGGEFLAASFRKVCEQSGILRQFTAPYTPQQNGVVERKNEVSWIWPELY